MRYLLHTVASARCGATTPGNGVFINTDVGCIHRCLFVCPRIYSVIDWTSSESSRISGSHWWRGGSVGTWLGWEAIDYHRICWRGGGGTSDVQLRGTGVGVSESS